MQTLIKTHKMNRTYHGDHFFILSKGNNAGKPLDKPCPNCFVVITECPQEKQVLYWLCFGLWKCRYFERHLIGSVIPFLRLPELKSIIMEIRVKIDSRMEEYEKAVCTLNKLQACRQTIASQLELIAQAEKSLIIRLVR